MTIVSDDDSYQRQMLVYEKFRSKFWELFKNIIERKISKAAQVENKEGARYTKANVTVKAITHKTCSRKVPNKQKKNHTENGEKIWKSRTISWLQKNDKD